MQEWNYCVGWLVLEQTSKIFVRSQLEQSSVAWHSSLTEQQKNDLERVKESALKIILWAKYESYQKTLNILDLEPLDQRRDFLCHKFTQKCMKNENTKHMFPLNDKEHNMALGKTEKFKVMHANTDRLKKSPIIYMQHLLNQLTWNKKIIIFFWKRFKKTMI